MRLAIALALAACAREPQRPPDYQTVDELMRDPAASVDFDIKIHGYLKLGTLKRSIIAQETVYDFVLHDKAREVAVHHVGPVPDTFQERAEVVAAGRLARDGAGFRFDATEIFAKCPSTYQTKDGPMPASKFR